MTFSQAFSVRTRKNRFMLSLDIESQRRFDAATKSYKLPPALKDLEDNSCFLLYSFMFFTLYFG